jgi:hypothetical protein
MAVPALGIDEPLAPIEHGRFDAISSGHLGEVRLDLMLAVLAPNDQSDACGGSVAVRHRRAGVRLHLNQHRWQGCLKDHKDRIGTLPLCPLVP